MYTCTQYNEGFLRMPLAYGKCMLCAHLIVPVSSTCSMHGMLAYCAYIIMCTCNKHLVYPNVFAKLAVEGPFLQ